MNTNTFTCKLATAARDLDSVYKIRHECYLRNGSIDARPDARFSDTVDDLPNHFSFLGCDRGAPLATVRVSVVRPDLGWNQAPSCKVFGDHPAFRRMQAGSFSEASRLCFGEQARRDVLFRLIAHLAAVAEVHGVRWLVSAVPDGAVGSRAGGSATPCRTVRADARGVAVRDG
ncbi:MAG: hypothetical protein FJW39_19950 [Acidobacteria bacterium]|nr:hypothetical protein [Acidobacteriota bacterium]